LPIFQVPRRYNAKAVRLMRDRPSYWLPTFR